MERASLINKYSRFDTPDIAERIAEKINKYIEYDGIEYLPGREIHGRHTGYLTFHLEASVMYMISYGPY